MKRRWSGTLSWTTFLIFFAALFVVVGFTYPKEVRIVPLVIGIPTLILLIVLWAGEFYPDFARRIDAATLGRRKKKTVPVGMSPKGSEFTNWGPVLIIIAWVVIYYGLVFLLGFALVSPIFIAAFLVRKARMGKLAAGIYAVIGTVLIYVAMSGWIKADLWSGAIPRIIPDLLGGAIIPPL